MATNPQRENLESRRTAALERRGVESVKAQLLHTGHGQGAEFRGLLPGDNRNPSRREVEKWLAKRERRDRCMVWAVRISALVLAAVGIVVAIV